MDVYKISSSDLTNKPFIEYMCKFNKPIILSTGASNLYEVQEAVSWIEKYGNPLALLHCVLNYPTPDKKTFVKVIVYLDQILILIVFPFLLVVFVSLNFYFLNILVFLFYLIHHKLFQEKNQYF